MMTEHGVAGSRGEGLRPCRIHVVYQLLEMGQQRLEWEAACRCLVRHLAMYLGLIVLSTRGHIHLCMETFHHLLVEKGHTTLFVSDQGEPCCSFDSSFFVSFPGF